MDENYAYTHVNVLTGGIGCGKSLVASILETLGASVVSADALTSEIYQAGSPILKKIASEFGASILENGNSLNRKKLSAIVFKDPSAKARLEQIVHPEVRSRALEKFNSFIESGSSGPIIYECPLFFETELCKLPFRKVIVVTARMSIRKKRIKDRDGLLEQEIEQRMNSQMPIEEKVSRADYVLENNSTIDDLRVQVESLYQSLLS